jgi:Glycosyltransferase (GlcNAc)
MVSISRKPSSETTKGRSNVSYDPYQRIALRCIAFIFVSLALYVASTIEDVEVPTTPSLQLQQPPSRRQIWSRTVRHAVVEKRRQLIRSLTSLRRGNGKIPIVRLQRLRDEHQIVGERLKDLQAGTKNIQEIILGGSAALLSSSAQHSQPPMKIDEIRSYLDAWIHQLHETLRPLKLEGYEVIWQAYHDLTVKTLFPWDQEYLSRMPERRDDGSIFLSLASYRDENCFNTLHWAYGNATNPEKLFTGLVQQNCVNNCKTGVLVGGIIQEAPPDDGCHDLFCRANPSYCGNIRHLFIDEDESLGPYAARYFASKLWYGESWYLQVDAHMTFLKDWDSISIQMLNAAPTKKPVLSHYPPGHTDDLEKMAKRPTERLCGPVFAGSQVEGQIVRLEGSGVSFLCKWYRS